MATMSKQSSTTGSREPATWVDQLFGLSLGIALVLILIGVYAAFLGWRTGGFVAIGAALAIPVVNVSYAIRGYRRIMKRPWPKVPPIEEDDDEW